MKILVIVDMQNDFITGPLGTPEAQAIVPKVCEEIKRRAAKDTFIIFTKDTHEENYLETLEGKNLPVKHCIKNTKGHSIDKNVYWAYLDNIEKFHPYNSETPPYNALNIIEKKTFGSTGLQALLRLYDDDIEEVTFMGVCTGICVLSNAILAKATLPEVPVNVVADCCACVTPESHKTALEAMKLCQINIV